jgi:hypothetical protein
MHSDPRLVNLIAVLPDILCLTLSDKQCQSLPTASEVLQKRHHRDYGIYRRVAQCGKQISFLSPNHSLRYLSNAGLVFSACRWSILHVQIRSQRYRRDTCRRIGSFQHQSSACRTGEQLPNNLYRCSHQPTSVCTIILRATLGPTFSRATAQEASPRAIYQIMNR